MASLQSQLVPYVIEAFTSDTVRDAVRFTAETSRWLRGAKHEVHYFHQVDDPYAQLVAQRLAEFAADFDVEFLPHLVPPPAEDTAPEPEALIAYARKDAAAIAPHYRCEFEDPGHSPSAAACELAAKLLAGAIRSGDFSERAADIGAALWSDDPARLEALAAGRKLPSSAAVARARAEGAALREELGHYSSATFHYGGEWYWGLDRVDYLRDRLAGLGLRRDGASTLPLRPTGGARSETRDLHLEVFVSLRSPYSYIALESLEGFLAANSGLKLEIRPVLPMVMRGLPVPSVKRMYILSDSKREAARLGHRFGRIADPVGKPVERGLSIFPLARERGRERAYLREFTRAVWSRGVDAGEEAGLRSIVEAAGLDWGEAEPCLSDEGWRDEIEANRAALFEAGLWGVPSYRLRSPGGDSVFSTWGQDRLWLVESEIARLSGA